MKLIIDLDEAWGHEECVSDIIKEEIKDGVRRKVKQFLRDKNGELTKAIELYARSQAKALEEKLTGATAIDQLLTK